MKHQPILKLRINEQKPEPCSAAKLTFGFGLAIHTWFGSSVPVTSGGVCEYATHDVQYLHARGVVHGDLKGNNIVVGSDMKAKLTDFGLSSSSESEGSSPISGAWHWAAPECLIDKETEQARARPTFEFDVYSLGMCVLEAMRVFEAARSGKPSRVCLPWGILANPVVKYHASHGKLPRIPECTADQWELVRRMCSWNPKERIKISTVVDELETGEDDNRHDYPG
ncbi:unnamed protein product [Phytophthora fragariaefolia]|uniref:Unnamed protein product n=1 Tax=Phytophthora fragariaefolia TaxID=1490495 RepID=A0A9W6XTA3_9STRA|nr:unnamed protein product [Phytophthora fragariaefolia]